MLSLRTSSVAALSVLAAVSAASAQLVRSGAGPTAGDIAAALAGFRADLGTLNPNQPGTFLTGRREINWDAVPDASSDPNFLAPNFFNGPASPRSRGVVFSTPGSGFFVSADDSNPTATPQDFASIDPSYANEFAAFSPQRLFTATDSTITDVAFFVPGTSQPATTRGFGAVFSDVDLAGSAYIEYYDVSNVLIHTAHAPAAGIGQATFSFVGASWDDPVVARVRIISGTAALGAGVLDRPDAAEFPTDLVVMDDFIYGEPVPAPGGAIVLAGVAGVAAARRRRA